MAFIAVYITHPGLEEAKRITGHLLERRLIACANLFPMESAYRWQGAVEHAQEVVSLVKTRPEHWEALKDEVERLHPYETPCIMKLEVEANAAYEAWIRAETR